MTSRWFLPLLALSLSCSSTQTADPTPVANEPVLEGALAKPTEPTKPTPRPVVLTDGVCKGWTVDACTNLGGGFFGPIRGKRAIPYFEQACTQGSSWACTSWGDVYYIQDAMADDSAPKAGLWLPIFQDACSKGHHSSCSRLAASKAVGSGWEVLPKDESGGFEAMRKLCAETGNQGCAFMANAHRKGLYGLTADPVKGDAVLQGMCETFPSGGCFALAEAHERGQLHASDPSQVPLLMATSCKAGDARACRALSTIHTEGKYGAAQDVTLASSYLDRACLELGNLKTCNELALTHIESSNVTAARDIHEQMCTSGYISSCQTLVTFYLYGAHDTPRDEARGLEVLRISCAHGGEEDCFEVGKAYLKGENGLDDPERGHTLMKLSCAKGYEEACSALEIR